MPHLLPAPLSSHRYPPHLLPPPPAAASRYGQHHAEAIFYIHALGLAPLVLLQPTSPLARLQQWAGRADGAAAVWILLVLNLLACQLCKRAFFALLGCTSSLSGNHTLQSSLPRHSAPLSASHIFPPLLPPSLSPLPTSPLPPSCHLPFLSPFSTHHLPPLPSALRPPRPPPPSVSQLLTSPLRVRSSRLTILGSHSRRPRLSLLWYPSLFLLDQRAALAATRDVVCDCVSDSRWAGLFGVFCVARKLSGTRPS